MELFFEGFHNTTDNRTVGWTWKFIEADSSLDQRDVSLVLSIVREFFEIVCRNILGFNFFL